MPLGAREVLVLLRAKDQASRVISGVGSSFSSLDKKAQASAQSMIGMGTALMGAGIAIGTAGALGLAFFNDATNAAIAYNKSVALTMTQVDNVNIKFADLRTLGLDIANRFPVAFDSIQKSLYDIFSTMDVNLSETKTLEEAFAKASVGGQVDIQAAGRTTMAIMNAFKIPVKDVTKVLDVQFQLVRKGVGTYEEFNSTIGRAIPSAARAGQTIQTLAGMLAFLTRNGLSTAMASASAARALDAMANPKVTDRLAKMGVQVKDAHGNFMPLVDVLGQANEKFKGLTKPELAKALEQLFKGAGGTIQARRFFDLVFQNFDQFKARVGEMSGSAGQMQSAFDRMMSTEASKAELLNNKYQVMKVTIGQQLIPVKLKLMEIVSKLLDWWNKLSPGTQKIIVRVLAAAAAFAVILGVILTVVGAVMMIMGLMELLGLTLAGVATAVGIVSLVLVALGIVIFLVIKYHKQIAEAAKVAWSYIKQYAKNAWDFLQPILEAIGNFFMHTLPDAFSAFVDAMVTAWDAVTNAISSAWAAIEPLLVALWGWIENNLGPVFQAWSDLCQAVWDKVAEAVRFGVKVFGIAKDVIVGIMHIIGPSVKETMQIISIAWKLAWNIISNFTKVQLNIIKNIINVFIAVVKAVWKPFMDFMFLVVRTVFNLIKTAVESALRIIKGIIEIATGLIRGDWSKVWQGISDIFGGVWHAIKNTVTIGVNFMTNAIKTGWNTITRLFTGAGPAILKAIGDFGHLLFDVGKSLIQGLINGITSLAGSVGGAIMDTVKKAIPGPARDLISKVPGMGWLHAKGGLFTKPTLGVIGEAGPELLLPLNNPTRMQQLMRQAGLIDVYKPPSMSMPHLMGGTTGANNVVVQTGAIQLTVQGSLDSATVPTVQKMLDDALEELTRHLR